MGCVVRPGSLLVNVTSPDNRSTEGLGRHREASYSARQVGMRPGCLRVLGVPRPPDKARWGHTDLNHGRVRPLVAHVELVGSFPMGQDRFGSRTDVGLTFPGAREKAAVSRDEENCWLTPPGCSSLERMENSTLHDGSNENESNPSFTENGGVGGVIGVRLPGGRVMVSPGFEASPTLTPLSWSWLGRAPRGTRSPSRAGPAPPSSVGQPSFSIASAWGPSVPTPFAPGPTRVAPSGGLAQPIPPPVVSPAQASREVGAATPWVTRPSVALPAWGGGGDSGRHVPAPPRFSRPPESQRCHFPATRGTSGRARRSRASVGPACSAPELKARKNLGTYAQGTCFSHVKLGSHSRGKRALLSRAGRLIGTIRRPCGSWATGAAWPALSSILRLLRGLRLTGRSCRCPLGVR